MTPVKWDILLSEYFFFHNLRPATEWSYRKVVKSILAFSERYEFPDDISSRDVLVWRKHILSGRNLSAQTWNNKIAHLRALFNFGMEHGLLVSDKNPFNDCSVRKTVKQKKTLNKKQLARIYILMQQKIIDEEKGNVRKRCALYPAWFWLTVIDTLRYTGMRLNQLLHIKLCDINLDDSCIKLCLDGSKTHREWQVPVINSLKPQLVRLIKEARQAGVPSNGSVFNACYYLPKFDMDSVMIDSNGMMQNIRSFFRRLSKECGFPVSPHRFRHTLATELMRAPDRNLQLVKELLGHRSVSTTMEYVEMNMDVVGRTLETELMFYASGVSTRDNHV
ncbi:site-specific integrase [Enterobacter bugandensis]|uniref:tyrosine-type recombinase/integrase n=1 Tax=Enterobacter bugandensis TaxID=881260 RepID=UPI002FCF1663